MKKNRPAVKTFRRAAKFTKTVSGFFELFLQDGFLGVLARGFPFSGSRHPRHGPGSGFSKGAHLWGVNRGIPREAGRSPPCLAPQGMAAAERGWCARLTLAAGIPAQAAAMRPVFRQTGTRTALNLGVGAVYGAACIRAALFTAPWARSGLAPQGARLRVPRVSGRRGCAGILWSGKASGRRGCEEMRVRTKAVFRRLRTCPGYPAVFGRKPGSNDAAHRAAVGFSRMRLRNANRRPWRPAGRPDERSAEVQRRRYSAGRGRSEAGCTGRAAWPAVAGGEAWSGGRRKMCVFFCGVGFWKNCVADFGLPPMTPQNWDVPPLAPSAGKSRTSVGGGGGRARRGVCSARRLRGAA